VPDDGAIKRVVRSPVLGIELLSEVAKHHPRVIDRFAARILGSEGYYVAIDFSQRCVVLDNVTSSSFGSFSDMRFAELKSGNVPSWPGNCFCNSTGQISKFN
jgi:hypothetical protein